MVSCRLECSHSITVYCVRSKNSAKVYHLYQVGGTLTNWIYTIIITVFLMLHMCYERNGENWLLNESI